MNCVILTTSNEFNFVYQTIEQINKIVEEINILIGTKFWDEQDEENLIICNDFKQDIELKYNNVKVLFYNVPEDKLIKNVSDEYYWEGHARFIGIQSFNKNQDYILFLDADEYIEGDKFKFWIDLNDYKKYDVLKLKNYWYWREPIYRAYNYVEDSVVLIKTSILNENKDILFSDMGRHNMYENLGKNKKRMCGLVEPFIHHYSWCRDKKNMIKKVKNWGHRNDTNWVEKVEEEFSREFNGTDFLKGLSYEIVESKIYL